MKSTMLAAYLVIGVAFGQMSAPMQGSAIDAKALAKAEKEYLSAKKAYDRHHSPTSKHAFVVACDRYALSSAYADSLPSKLKYRQALRLYREALKVDPSNHEAKQNADFIISIYRSLHRPVPPN